MPRLTSRPYWQDRLIVWAIGIAVLIGMLWLSPKVYGQEIEFKITPNPAYPGDLIILKSGDLPAGAVCSSAWINFDDAQVKAIDLFRQENHCIGLGAIPLSQPGGNIKIFARVNSRSWSNLSKLKLEIGQKIWPERSVGEMAPLSPKKLARYQREKALIKKALGTTASEPLWQEKFSQPLFCLIGMCPTILMRETSPFGQKRIGPIRTRQHRGVDLRATVGEPIYSMNSGRVVLTGNFLADGKIVIIDHGLGLHTLYLHLSRIKVKKGQMVKRGQLIGRAGNTGFSEGPHLHLEVRVNGEPVNPLQILEILK